MSVKCVKPENTLFQKKALFSETKINDENSTWAHVLDTE
jgi:hypothetical protein